MKRTTALMLASLLVVACGSRGGLTSAERAWCSFSDESAAAADRFDLIFEVGLALQLNMDHVNATAAARRAQYESEGVPPEEAITRVSEELLEMEAFVEACKAAYAEFGAGG